MGNEVAQSQGAFWARFPCVYRLPATASGRLVLESWSNIHASPGISPRFWFMAAPRRWWRPLSGRRLQLCPAEDSVKQGPRPGPPSLPPLASSGRAHHPTQKLPRFGSWRSTMILVPPSAVPPVMSGKESPGTSGARRHSPCRNHFISRLKANHVLLTSGGAPLLTLAPPSPRQSSLLSKVDPLYSPNMAAPPGFPALLLRLSFLPKPAFLLFLVASQFSWLLPCCSMACEYTLDLGRHHTSCGMICSSPSQWYASKSIRLSR